MHPVPEMPAWYMTKFSYILQNLNEPGTVAQACNPSYLGDRDPEGHSSRPVWAKNS
jgi:hypothetical protein